MNQQQKETIDLLLREGNDSDAFKHLHKWLEGNSHDGDLHYYLASTYDSKGNEKKAYPHYEKAIELGLDEEELKGAFLGLGSTYRTLGMYEESKSTLEFGLTKFPEDNALKVFYSLTLYNVREHEKAMEVLLTCLLETTQDQNILQYRNALALYSKQLNRIWV
ncbi:MULTISPECIES: tetratricopeptide repeat protein [Shouchella]|uniref:Tetratricopeptide repeat protein n=1 Tax=Shouchella hunanensis TaxID=766894 RepID=A0ABY7W8K9_9BACI|nr:MULTISPECIES: tetratricopeptide repeat protein [Shouchella]WDF05270.1 tetratricopeptide repeat protein [Shouchella hunanensis]